MIFFPFEIKVQEKKEKKLFMKNNVLKTIINS